MSSEFTQEEVDALLKLCSRMENNAKHHYVNLVELEGKVYGFDVQSGKYAELELAFKSDDVPDKAMKLLAMKRFGLVEKNVEKSAWRSKLAEMSALAEMFAEIGRRQAVKWNRGTLC